VSRGRFGAGARAFGERCAASRLILPFAYRSVRDSIDIVTGRDGGTAGNWHQPASASPISSVAHPVTGYTALPHGAHVHAPRYGLDAPARWGDRKSGDRARTVKASLLLLLALPHDGLAQDAVAVLVFTRHAALFDCDQIARDMAVKAVEGQLGRPETGTRPVRNPLCRW
jgi:hypothetical protein